ncbi:hypothetical protein GDO86_020587 [Hymenochirus boettgeri]|uniref:Uncharacterized protein n=1 Tax=Hymenochirus boettgeri TaxID=247094 RepID=A0A8T2IFH8_9PIPI|nr:hypothetical protein GDO86_020587 [Hymenochirus boettgeri]
MALVTIVYWSDSESLAEMAETTETAPAPAPAEPAPRRLRSRRRKKQREPQKRRKPPGPAVRAHRQSRDHLKGAQRDVPGRC